MYLLDTDHLSVLERGGTGAEPLRERLRGTEASQVLVSVVSYEEQTRGWLGMLAAARDEVAVVAGYGHLERHLDLFCGLPLVGFNTEAAQVFAALRRQRIRLGSMDLRIASIALALGATLLTRNVADFSRVPGLRVED